MANIHYFKDENSVGPVPVTSASSSRAYLAVVAQRSSLLRERMFHCFKKDRFMFSLPVPRFLLRMPFFEGSAGRCRGTGCRSSTSCEGSPSEACMPSTVLCRQLWHKSVRLMPPNWVENVLLVPLRLKGKDSVVLHLAAQVRVDAVQLKLHPTAVDRPIAVRAKNALAARTTPFAIPPVEKALVKVRRLLLPNCRRSRRPPIRSSFFAFCLGAFAVQPI